MISWDTRKQQGLHRHSPVMQSLLIVILNSYLIHSALSLSLLCRS